MEQKRVRRTLVRSGTKDSVVRKVCLSLLDEHISVGTSVS